MAVMGMADPYQYRIKRRWKGCQMRWICCHKEITAMIQMNITIMAAW